MSDEVNDTKIEEEPVKKSPISKVLILVGIVVVIVLYLVVPSYLIITNAKQIVTGTLRSPSSFTSLDSRIMWKGVDVDGIDSYIVLIEYEAENGFGGMVRDCKVVAYQRDGQNLLWNNRSSFESCPRELAGIFTEEGIIDVLKATNFGIN